MWNSLIQEQVRASHIPGEGSESNQDAARVEKMFPTLSQTPEGRAAILGYLEAKQNRKIEFDNAAWMRQNSLIDDTEYQKRIGKILQNRIDISPLLSLGSSQPNQAAPQSGTPGTSAPKYKVGQRAIAKDGSLLIFNGTRWVQGG
ncbi:hypothetical protein [Acetobacter senegalensis]|uniref:hypothetical protein n=1 Tax=Acetobacter senegalensis TaxID=446692 RepID=UPI002653001B|nr:hypothetical protein [Acetobacter senegalensis]MDN7356004.1 hypothetical protein [Acetobacter senegalensis]